MRRLISPLKNHKFRSSKKECDANCSRKSRLFRTPKMCFEKSDPPVKDATDLARLFNLQHRAVSCIGIAVQAAHKWLSGLAIPSADKIATLAKWLNMSEH